MSSGLAVACELPTNLCSSVRADSKVLKWYEELHPVELNIEATTCASNDTDETTPRQTEVADDDDMEYWAAFDDDDATPIPADVP